MKKISSFCTRRGFFGGLALGTAALWTRGVFAESLMRTPAQTAGPFYPDKLPLDTDNDLLVINDEITPAVGAITHLSGKILDERGERIKNAVVEIWQVDNNGVYHHSGTANREKRDTNFQGFGRFTTGSTGEYYFRTIKPVVYPGRQAPHIHFKIKKGGKALLTTQCYVQGHAGNERDGVFKRIGDAKTRASLAVDFAPIEDSRSGELAARFDIVLGMTPEST